MSRVEVQKQKQEETIPVKEGVMNDPERDRDNPRLDLTTTQGRKRLSDPVSPASRAAFTKHTRIWIRYPSLTGYPWHVM